MSAQLSLWGNLTGGDLQLEIERYGFAVIEHDIPTEAIDELVSAHAAFTDNHPDPEADTMNAMIRDTSELDALDFAADRQREWHKYRTNAPHFAKPNGHTNRFLQAEVLRQYGRKKLNSKTGEYEVVEEDPKEFFHYTPGYREDLAKRHEIYGWGPVPPEAMELARTMHVVHYMVKRALTPVFAKLEATHPKLREVITPEDLDISPLRSLRYHQGQGEVLGGGHHDRGIFTMQVADSHRGLRVRDPSTHKMTLVETPPNASPVFPADKWRTAHPDSPLRSLWHDVVNDPTACEGRPLYGNNIARYAIILFVNSRKIGDRADKIATHTEVQENLVA